MEGIFSIRRRDRQRERRNAYAFEPTAMPAQRGDRPRPKSTTEEQPRPSRSTNTDWCSCGHCRPMPKEKECTCCREREECQSKMEDSGQCISLMESFKKICLDKEILEVVFASRKEVLGESVTENELTNRNYRHIGYRCFIWWMFNRLKKKDRRVIPSCAVWAIREKFPEVDGQYRGFMDAVDDDEVDFVFE